MIEIYQEWYKPELLRKNLNKIYVYGDNISNFLKLKNEHLLIENKAGKGKKGQAIIRDEINSFGIMTKLHPGMTENDFCQDTEEEKNILLLQLEKLKELEKKFIIVFPKDGIGTGLAEMKKRAPKNYEFLVLELFKKFNFIQDYEIIKKNFKFYTGIGARKTPLFLKNTINEISKELELKNYILRSGGANGADSFFEENKQLKEIYLPSKNFNKNLSPYYYLTEEHFQIASHFHPVWNQLEDYQKKFMARNVSQVLGFDLKTPTHFLICWTNDGVEKEKTTTKTGGTGMAIRLAQHYNIPIFNLKNEKTLDRIKNNLLNNCNNKNNNIKNNIINI